MVVAETFTSRVVECLCGFADERFFLELPGLCAPAAARSGYADSNTRRMRDYTADEPEPPDVSVTVQSGSYTTTVRQGDDVEIPFSEVVLVDVEFEEEIYNINGRTFAEAETEPIDWRVLEREPENRRASSFAIRNQEPGTVTVTGMFHDYTEM